MTFGIRLAARASVLCLSITLFSTESFALGKKRPIEWNLLPELKSELLLVSSPSLPKLSIDGNLSTRNVDTLLASHDVTWTEAEAIRFLKENRFSSEGMREVSRKSLANTKHLCLETPVTRSSEFEIRFSLDEWLESQSVWCKIGNTFFHSCRPESISDALELTGISAQQISTQQTAGQSQSIEITSPETCINGSIKARSDSPYVAMEQVKDLSVENLAKTNSTRQVILGGSFTEPAKDQFVVRFKVEDQATLQNSLPEETTKFEEIITETREIESIRIGAIELTRAHDEWVGKTKALSLIRKMSPSAIMPYPVSVRYRIETLNSLNSSKTFRTETESKSIEFKTRSWGSIDKSVWNSLSKLAHAARPNSQVEGPFIVTAGARGGEITTLCDGKGEASVENACYSVVFLRISSSGRLAELLTFRDPEKTERFKFDFGHVAVQGQNLFNVEGSEIDSYEARLIRSRVTERFPESQYRYFIDGQSAGATFANVFGALTLGFTLGKFERVMVPKTDIIQRIFVEAETVGSILWIPTKDLVTILFERIQ